MADAQLVFTEQAAAKVWSLIQEEGNFNLKLRAFVTGGGCSGLKYAFTFEEQISEDDIVITKKVMSEKQKKEDDETGEESQSDSGTSVQLLIDPLSFQYLQGAEIDYKEDLEGGSFIIRNPNAKTTCGCGSSFTT